jgi:hypothetical protein
MEPEYKTTYLKASPPFVDSTGPTTVLNYSFTLPEAIYIGYIIKALEGEVTNGASYIFLDASQKIQDDFTQFVNNKFASKRQFTVAELELNSIVTSVWGKTKLYVKNTLEFYELDIRILNEDVCLDTADRLARERQNGHPGKMITSRQAKLLVTLASQLKKPETT